MVIVLKRHEAEWLQHSLFRLLHGSEYLRHSMHGTSLRLERNFYEVALSQRIGNP